MSEEITLADPRDALNFRIGQPLVMIENRKLCTGFDQGWTYRPARPRERAAASLRNAWHRATRWWRPRTVCAAVDVDAGVVMLATERWSWLRWRWERT